MRKLRTALKSVLRQYRVEIVHLHSITHLCRPLIKAARAIGIPMIATLHEGAWVCPNYFFENNVTKQLCTEFRFSRCIACRFAGLRRGHHWKSWPRDLFRALSGVVRVKLIYRPLLERLDKIVGCCDYAVQQYRNFRVRAPATTIRNLIPDGEIRPKTVSPVGLPLRIGVLGGFREQKGGDILLTALGLLHDRYDDFRVEVWGPTPTLEPPDGFRIPLSLPIRIRGYYERAQLSGIFDSIDLIVHASTWDTYPTVVLEALASRTPVVAVRATGAVEIVEEGVNGRFFERNDPVGLASAIEWFLDNPAEIERMQRCMEIPSPYETMLNSYADLYARIAHEQEGNPIRRRGVSHV